MKIKNTAIQITVNESTQSSIGYGPELQYRLNKSIFKSSRYWLFCTLFVFSCRQENSSGQLDTVYGKDERVDREALSVETNRIKTASAATVALFERKRLSPVEDGFQVKIKTLIQQEGVCLNESFALEPILADCSGVLIGQDLIATAAHCVTDSQSCEEMAIAFDFSMPVNILDSKIVLPKKNLYFCKELLWRQYQSDGIDLAIMRLDRVVKERKPIEIEPILSEKLKWAELRLAAAGHPSGLPLKIALNGKIWGQKQESIFIADVDTFAGNSGGPIFNIETGRLLGILVRGGKNYTLKTDPRDNKSCFVPYVCPEVDLSNPKGSCRGEDFIAATLLLPHLK